MNKRSRANGEGTIYRLKDSRFLWIAYKDRNGKRVCESSKTTKMTEAKALLRQRVEAVASGQPTHRVKRDAVPFSRLVDLLNTDYEKNGNRSRNGKRFIHLEPYFANVSADQISEAEIDKYATDRIKEGAAPATVNRELACLRRMLRLALRARLVERVPVFAMLKENNVRKGFMEREDYEKIRKHLPEHIRAITDVAYITGWRSSELLSRDWSHVDLKAGWLRLDAGETKNGEPRMFPLIPELRAVLEEQKRQKLIVEKSIGRIVRPLFFYYDTNGRKQIGERIRDFRAQWAKACKAAEYPNQLIHDFRRTAARNLIRAGVPEPVAMKLTGHLTASIFRRYGIVDESMLKEGAAKLSGFLSASAPKRQIRATAKE